jgi:class I fructose-bisphosphate aldolase
MTEETITDIAGWLGGDAEDLLSHRCEGLGKELPHLPGADYVERVVAQSDRKPAVLRSSQALLHDGRLRGQVISPSFW